MRVIAALSPAAKQPFEQVELELDDPARRRSRGARRRGWSVPHGRGGARGIREQREAARGIRPRGGVQTGTGACAARRVGGVANTHAIARGLKPVQEKATDCVAARRKQ